MGAAPPSRSPGRSEEPSEPLTLYLVKQVELAIRAQLDETLRPHGLTTPQYTALSVLARGDGMSSAALARRSFVTAQSMHEMVVLLEGRGLVERTRDPANRRERRVVLTAQGRDRVDACAAGVQRVEDAVLGALAPGERPALRSSLSRAYDALVAPGDTGAT